MSKDKDEEIKELLDLLKEAKNHLEYCNYGDKWERECAFESGLAKRLILVIDKYENQH